MAAVPDERERTAPPMETVHGATAVEQVKRKTPPVVSPTGEPSAVEYVAHAVAGAPPRETFTVATPYATRPPLAWPHWPQLGALSPLPLSPFVPLSLFFHVWLCWESPLLPELSLLPAYAVPVTPTTATRTAMSRAGLEPWNSPLMILRMNVSLIVPAARAEIGQEPG